MQQQGVEQRAILEAKERRLTVTMTSGFSEYLTSSGSYPSDLEI